MTTNLRAACFAVLLGLSALGIPGVALGSGPQHCEPPRYEWVLTHESRREAYRVCETRRDECGRAYTVHVVRYRTVQTPVWRYVRVR